jgi:hypothetical protein
MGLHIHVIAGKNLSVVPSHNHVKIARCRIYTMKVKEDFVVLHHQTHTTHIIHTTCIYVTPLPQGK